jgi:hypothetical protein
LLKKRKLEEMRLEGDDIPVILYGIVTTGREWVFLRWAGSSSALIVYNQMTFRIWYSYPHLSKISN